MSSMPRLMILPLALGGMVLAVLVAGAARQNLSKAAIVDRTDLRTAKAATAEKSAASQPVQPAEPLLTERDKSVRAIERHAFVPPFSKNADGLERLPARAPLTPPPPKPVEKQPGLLLPRPVVEKPGILTFADRQVALSGLTPFAVEKTCGEGDAVWPCGEWALNALRRLLRGRAVDCAIPDPDWKGTVTAACTVAGRDISGWMVENGWAAARPGSPFAAAMHEASEKRVGVFGSDPRMDFGSAPVMSSDMTPEVQ